MGESFYQYSGAPEKGEAKAGEIFTHLTFNTTAHGMPHVAKAKGGFKKAFWWILSLSFVAALSYNIYVITALYFSYPVKVVISLQHEEELNFPAVSICNMSPVRLSLWEQYLNETSLEQTTETNAGSQTGKRRRRRSTSTRACPSGWTEADDSCVIAGTSDLTFDDAQLACEDLLGNLVTIDNATVNAVVATLASSEKHFIGLSVDLGFTDGTSSSAYDNFSGAEPDDDTGCTRLRNGNRAWTDEDCTDTNYIVCSTDDTAACTGAGTWLDSGTRCYHADATATFSWADGDSRCDSLYPGAELAIIDSAAEQSYVVNNVVNSNSGNSFWFGLRYTYEWKDGSPYSYSSWSGGEPSNFPDCSAMKAGSGTWQTDSYTHTHKYVCQKGIPCAMTGTSCIDIADCSSTANGNYQSCEGCDHYVTCTSSAGVYISCPASQVWNDNTGACDSTSPTCTECYEDVTTVADITTTTIVDTTLGIDTTLADTTLNVPATTLPDTTLIVPGTTLADTTVNVPHTTLADTTVNVPGTTMPDTTVPPIITTNPPATTMLPDTTPVVDTTQGMDTTQPVSIVTTAGDTADTCSCCCGNQYVYVATPSTGNGSESTTSVLSSEPQYEEDSQHEDKPVLREEFQKGEELIETFVDIDPVTRAALGFSLSDLVVDCQFEGSDCSINDFDTFTNPLHGNCYTYNSGWYKDVKLSKQSGRRYGLHLTLNLNQDEYIGDFDDTAGMRVVIHQGSRMAFPEDEGITVAPGVVSLLAMKQVTVARLGEPYGDCVDPEHSHAEVNVYEEQYPVNYSTTACQKTCLQKAIIEECDCADAYYPTEGSAFGDVDVGICSSSDLTQDDCKFGVQKKFENHELRCDCPNPCINTLYSLDISTGQWPSDVQRDTLLDRYASQIPDLLNDPNDPDKFTRNLMKVEIYYQEFNYENMEEQPSYLGGNYASDLGGVLGLWFGLSLLTVFEFIEFAMDMCVLGCYKCWRSRKTSKDGVRSLAPRDTRYSLGDLELTSQSLLRLRGIRSDPSLMSRDSARDSTRDPSSGGSSHDSARETKLPVIMDSKPPYARGSAHGSERGSVSESRRTSAREPSRDLARGSIHDAGRGSAARDAKHESRRSAPRDGSGDFTLGSIHEFTGYPAPGGGSREFVLGSILDYTGGSARASTRESRRGSVPQSTRDSTRDPARDSTSASQRDAARDFAGGTERDSARDSARDFARDSSGLRKKGRWDRRLSHILEESSRLPGVRPNIDPADAARDFHSPPPPYSPPSGSAGGQGSGDILPPGGSVGSDLFLPPEYTSPRAHSTSNVDWY